MQTTPQKFIVAMIADDRNQLPAWVTQRLDEIPNLEVRYARCRTEEQLLAIATDADMIWTRHLNFVLTPEARPRNKKRDDSTDRGRAF